MLRRHCNRVFKKHFVESDNFSSDFNICLVFGQTGKLRFGLSEISHPRHIYLQIAKKLKSVMQGVEEKE